MKQQKGWRMSYDVGEVTEGLENELWRRWSDGRARNKLRRRWSEGRVGEWGSAEPPMLPINFSCEEIVSLITRHGGFPAITKKKVMSLGYGFRLLDLPVRQLLYSTHCRALADYGLYTGGVLYCLYTVLAVQLLCSFSADIMCLDETTLHAIVRAFNRNFIFLNVNM